MFSQAKQLDNQKLTPETMCISLSDLMSITKIIKSRALRKRFLQNEWRNYSGHSIVVIGTVIELRPY